MARMFLMCGHPGSGKSTYARELARKNGFRYLSIDDMYATFNGTVLGEVLQEEIMIEGLYKCFDHWHKQGTVWLYSDTHFNEDEDLRVPFPDRPSAEEQIKMINSKVGRKDTLILLGDVGDIECARKLRGYKILIKGNHDLGLSNYEDVFDEVYGGPLMIGEKIILSHEPLDIGWAFCLHGHNHNQKGVNKRGELNVCADVINYTPINFNQFVKSGRLKEIESIHRKVINKATFNKHGHKFVE